MQERKFYKDVKGNYHSSIDDACYSNKEYSGETNYAYSENNSTYEQFSRYNGIDDEATWLDPKATNKPLIAHYIDNNDNFHSSTNDVNKINNKQRER